jgi:predicted HTH domain antitoxin
MGSDTMAILINLSQEAEDALRAEWGDGIESAAKEALLIESYRTGRISLGYLAQLLGLSRWEAESWLGSRGVNWNYDVEDLEADRRTLSRLGGK